MQNLKFKNIILLYDRPESNWYQMLLAASSPSDSVRQSCRYV